MKKIASFILICGFAAVSHAATTITGCVTDAAGKPVPGAKVFASPETAAEKTFRTEARKSDGCYELKIGKDGSYRIGVRDLRFADDGPTQAEIVVPDSGAQKIDLSTGVPNAKLLGERLVEGLLSASDGFPRMRSVRFHGGDVPAVMARIPSGFNDCMLQSADDQNGQTALWWCGTEGSFAGIRDERIRDDRDADSMFKTIRDAIDAALGGVAQLRYAPFKPADLCENCVARAVWVSPINGVVSLSETKVRKRNILVLWIAYNSASSGEFVGDLGPNERTDVRRGPY